MKKFLAAFIILFAIMLSVICLAQTKDNVFKLEDLRKIVRLSDPQISPDGNRIAVIVSRFDWEKDKSKQEC